MINRWIAIGCCSILTCKSMLKDGMPMDFIISSAKIRKGGNAIVYDAEALSGVKKIASKVAGDIKAVFGAAPKLLENKDAMSARSVISSSEISVWMYPILKESVRYIRSK